MVYHEKFVATVLSDGKVLRENREKDDDILALPFGSEYSLRFKNLNSTRAAIDVSIDGQDVLDGSQLVISPNDDLDLEGFMKGDSVLNRFKFIKKTKQISDYRGDRIDDGIIRIAFRFEKKPAIVDTVEIRKRVIYDDYWSPWYPVKPLIPRNPRPWYGINDEPVYGASVDNVNLNDDFTSTRSLNPHVYHVSNCSNLSQQNSDFDYSSLEDGITVKGSDTNQKFSNTHLNAMEEKEHVIILRLRGYDSKKKVVTKPLTVKSKIQCETCGTKSKSSMKFCPNCGTRLL